MISELIDLRLGDWREILRDVKECDVLACDPPYSDRTHAGQRTGSSVRSPTINYSSFSEDDALNLATSMSKKTKHWAIIFSDHAGFCLHEKAWSIIGWYTFAPVIWLKDLCAPRLSGDGPACQAEYVLIARPRRALDRDRTGSRPGSYDVRGRRGFEPKSGIAGQKDIFAMRSLLLDYTKPGDLVVDPFCGSGTTALACAIEGRRCITCEIDPKTYELAKKRLSAGYTQLLPGMAA